MLEKVIDFLKTDLWRIRLKEYPRSKSFLLHQLRVLVLAVRGFNEDKCKFRASALTYFTLLSIVPVLAMVFGIAKGFGLEEKVEDMIRSNLAGNTATVTLPVDDTADQIDEQAPSQTPAHITYANANESDPNSAAIQDFQQEIAEKVIAFSKSMLENAKGGVIAGIGVALLFWAIIKMLSNIENAFNAIWGVKTPRSWARKFSDYLSIMLICPVLLVVSGSATVMISGQIQAIVQRISLLGPVAPVINMGLKILPYAALWITFTFIFIFMPNTKVRFKSALIAGIIGGTIFQLVQWGYLAFQIGVTKYNAIYGSFAALPLFLVWLQLSWLVVLFGAEISFAYQNVDTYEFEPDCLSVSYSYKRLLTLLITTRIVQNFCRGESPMTASEIAMKLEMPIRLVRQILFELVEGNVVSEVQINQNKDVAYQPAHDVDNMTVRSVIESIENRGNSNIPVRKTEELEQISKTLKRFSETLKSSSENVLLKNL